MKIRAATPEDCAVISHLTTQLGYTAAPEVLAERLRRLSAQPEHLVLVAEANDGTVLGWLHAAEHDLLETGRKCEILGLVIHQLHRRAGAGRALVEAAEQWAVARGLDEIAVRSNVIRTESHPFYEHIGFERVKTQHAYRKAIAR